MNWTKTPPTEPGKYYWKRCIDSVVWFVRDLISMGRLGLGDNGELLENIGGLWGGRVPAPGTTFTVEEIDEYLESHKCFPSSNNLNFALSCARSCFKHPQDGIAAVTARNRKEAG